MTISSTEFQQNVGYYLGLAEKGEEIEIRKLKPRKVTYNVTVKTQETKSDITNQRNSKRLEMIKDLNKIEIDYAHNNGLSFQKWVRD